jgi:hypothetical protein
MNDNMLTQIDDDMLDQVSGGAAEISIGPGAITELVDAGVSLATTGLQVIGGLVKTFQDFLPTIKLSWG